MNNTITDDLYSQLEGQPLQQISQQLGIGPAQMAGAISAALPLLIGALGRNASQGNGADALYGALQKDHRGLDISSVLGSVLGGDGQGNDILGHIFGGRQPRAEQGLGQATGIGNDKAGALLRVLAPIVMAYLARRMFDKRQAGQAEADVTPQVLGRELGQEQQRVSQQGGLGGGLLGAVLDRDGDGQIGMGDLLKMGGEALGGRR
ncbi:MAG: DUF937 domain-containing protein [Luteimonas sp.]